MAAANDGDVDDDDLVTQLKRRRVLTAKESAQDASKCMLPNPIKQSLS
ncbi:hypothetical protein COLO4_25687 [Corchorus olitorius]|uniref:Uncharacterized protein n=1 Tax=Corchorus olitorius TaxID=93759 RepID=A0A1R3I0D5_9ROSI|nr:hypothetical protein COLO4_25687 [Corchorus olitorius]